MSGYVLAIDQGTTSTRAIVFDGKMKVAGVGQKEFTQHYPKPGWVEHDPEEIWSSVLVTVRKAIEAAGITARILRHSALPISARPSSSGIARRANRSTMPSSGRTAVRRAIARN